MESGAANPSADEILNSCDEGLFDTDLLSRLRISDAEPLGELHRAPNLSAAPEIHDLSEVFPKSHAEIHSLELPTARQKAKTKCTGVHRLAFKRYLPLGALTYSSVVPTHKLQARWRESVFPPDALPEDHPLFLPLCQLLASSWIRIRTRFCHKYPDLATTRVYILPDDRGLGVLPKAFRKHRQALRILMDSLDVSKKAWEGGSGQTTPIRNYRQEELEDDSLFYMFNTLRSPCPDPGLIRDADTKDIIEGLLEGSPAIPGLRTKLYPYQRRSAAMMIQREIKPARMLDPRLETLSGPTSETFYFDREACVLLSNRREYEEASGGILAETMGYGKTLICLAVILQTKGHWPCIPPQFSLALKPTRSRTGSLMAMAAATLGRCSVPWKPYFERLAREGDDFQECLRSLRENSATYVIPGNGKKHARRPEVGPQGNTILLSSTTLVIVPPNLVGQWLQEISLHLDQSSLSVYVIDNLHQPLPPANELRDYDIILISKSRFERESSSHNATLENMKKKSKHCGHHGRCHCSSKTQLYHSPLKDLHFLRLVVDEGHAFASTGAAGNAGNVLNDLHVERKWIISGTPAAGLMGVEIEMAAVETRDGFPNNGHEASQEVLAARRKEIVVAQERKDIEKLGNIVVNFLHLRPWAKNVKAKDDEASWHKYVMTSKSGMRNTTSLKATLEGLVVRHSAGLLAADLALPPLYNRVVHLEPCRFDKLSINLFHLVLTVNAVTSERVDQDYMFHPSNRWQLDQLVRNLLQSGFYWTGFSIHEVSETVRVSQEYLCNPDKHVTESDRRTLNTAVQMGLLCLDSCAWRALSQVAEIGLFIRDFPQEAVSTWSFCPEWNTNGLLTGATQLQSAQKHVADHAYATNPADGLLTKGFTVMTQMWDNVRTRPGVDKTKQDGPTRHRPRSETGRVVPGSTIVVPHGMHRKNIGARKGDLQHTAVKSKPKPEKLNVNGLKSALKVKSIFHSHATAGLARDSPLNRTLLEGTASAKLSYLLDRITILHHTEKIIIFYEGDHIAWYIAQCLELIHIQHLIYAKGTDLALRASYLEWFNTSETYRVLLMDLRQAAHGLNVASASRIFFVNPVWSPSVEAQAIKRAHRIGQTRPVHVETLVLKGTFEEQLLERRKVMTTDEHQQAAKSILDDRPMNNMIKNLAFVPLSNGDGEDKYHQMAPLRYPRPVFGSAATDFAREASHTNTNIVMRGETPSSELQCRKRKAAFEPEPEEPFAHAQRRKVAYVDFDVQRVDTMAQVSSTGAPNTQGHKRKATFALEFEGDTGPEDMSTKR